jgi:NAD(P)-dependent dehydrogenase (short-subunit alcohol dehydrogenase family)
MDLRLEDKAVFVAGASRGFVEACLAEGATVVMAAYLLSPLGSFVTGAAVPVDGGQPC